MLILDHCTCGAFWEFKILAKDQENTSVKKDRHKEVADVAMAVNRFRRKEKPAFVQA